MGGTTSDHWGIPLENGPAAAVELSKLAAAAGPALAEYGGSDDQAEELEADRILETIRLDEELEALRREVELERAARELAERLREHDRLELQRVRAELADLKAGRRETYSREGEGCR